MKNFCLGKLFVLIVLLVVATVNSVFAAQQPYIPSYDDRYEEDLKQANSNKDYFIEPEDDLNYANYHYIGANQAERYPRFFTEYIWQEQTILGMLSTGARGLIISLYDWSVAWSTILRAGVSVVCSHPMDESTVFRKNGKPLYQTLHYEMNRIFNFLKSHPKAVITVFFNDTADIAKIVRDMREIISKNNYNPILKPSDWSAAQQKGEWPTLGWMRSNNKRLLLFTQIYNNHTDFTWPVKQYFWKNNYGSIDEKVLCSEERLSLTESNQKNRSLVSFSNHGNTSTSPGARNSTLCLDYDLVKQLTQRCQKRKFARGKLFNAYWVNHLIGATHTLTQEKRKTAFDYANELNIVPNQVKKQ